MTGSAFSLFAPIVGGAIGAAGGSFAATAALRSLRGESALSGRSHCDTCGLQLSYAATVPVLAFLVRRGRCPRCESAIPLVHPISEVVGAMAVSLTLLLAPPEVWAPLVAAVMLLIFGAVVDVRSLRLPDTVAAGVAICGVVAALSAGTIIEAIATASATGGVLLLSALAFEKVRGTPGLGFGDVKLLTALSTWTGPTLTPIALVTACIGGLVWIGVARRRERAGRIAFGPFIAAAFWCFALGRLAA